jgi:hypothetical protein
MTQVALDHEFAAILDGCLEALGEEVMAVQEELARRGLDRPLPGHQGRVQDSAGGSFFYEWKVPDGTYDIRPDDAVRVRTEASEAQGFVLGYQRARSVVRVAVGDWLGRHPEPVELEFDPTWLLAALATRLEAMREEPDKFHPDTVLRLFGRAYPELGEDAPRLSGSNTLNASQRHALGRLLGSDVHFVWGPPGTGKTLLLGHAVAELAERGSVLVATTTNGALDEAAARVAEVLGRGAVEANRIVRVGAEYSGTGDPSLSLDAAVERRVHDRGRRVSDAVEEMEREMLSRAQRREANGSIRRRHGRLVAMARSARDEEAVRRLSRIAGELQKQAVLALREADIVLSTLARLAVWDDLAALRFDSLVLDEASTSPLPYVCLAAAQTSGRAVAIGDFQQLPAVVVSRGESAERWLSRDAFREAGVVGDAPPGELVLPAAHDQLCAMLTEQYRMAPPVRELVSDLFYGGRLEDAAEVVERKGPAWPLVLLDTDSLDPSVQRQEGSRANAEHVEAVVRFLEVAAKEGIDDVAVVVPYRLQARRLGQLVRARLGRAAPRDLEVSTVHRFQGREKSLVVFDTVDAPPDRSWFLHEGRNRDFPRLLNVALSRTRFMLVVVAAVDGLRQVLPEEALLNRVVDRIRERGTVLDAKHIADAPRLFREIS